MSETDLARTITDLATPLAASLSLEIWGVEVMFGKRGIVRVYVEGENGVDIDRCAELSRLLGLSLEVEDVIPCAYVLEVSSPGLERVFFTPEQMAARVGNVVEVTLHTPTAACPDRKKLLGTLTGATDGIFSLLPLDMAKDAPREAAFSWNDVKKAKLIHFLPETPGPAKGRKPKQNKPPKAATAQADDGDGTQDHIRTDPPASPASRRKSA